MKLAIFVFIFAILIASIVSAAGLKITEIDFHVEYDEAYTYRVENRDKKDSGSVSPANNSKVDADLFPGSNITFTVRVENTFQSDGPTLKGVFARMKIKEIDDGADMEIESLDFDLEPGDDYRYDLEFSIPLDVDATTYDAVLEAEGEDKNETSYKARLDLKLPVKKQSHDIRITKALLNPEVVSCERKAKLSAEIMNLGPNPETQNALEFRSDALGINSVDKDISLESSDEASEEEKTYSKSLNLQVAEPLDAGTYSILINLYWKNFVLFDKKEVQLVVKECSAESKIALTENKKENITEPQSGGNKQNAANLPKPPIAASPALVFVLVGGLIALAVLAIVFKHTKIKPGK